MSKWLLILLCSGCIPFIAPRTDNPRRGIWVLPTGHAWAWHVDQPEVVKVACGPYAPEADSCTIWREFSKVGAIWVLDSRKVAAHECKHALQFAYAKTKKDIADSVNHVGWSGTVWSFPGMNEPAKERPCE